MDQIQELKNKTSQLSDSIKAHKEKLGSGTELITALNTRILGTKETTQGIQKV
jgi:predicted  nucleic acid-binding Zn-ribbon protein